MNRFIVATGLVCGAAAPVGAQQIVGRTETSFSIKAAVAGGDWESKIGTMLGWTNWLASSS